jgi:penicillin-binding protein-related factor A (putative recombinase)
VKEQDTVRAILQYLGARHILAWRINVGAVTAKAHGFNASDRFIRFSPKGMSDIIGVMEGRFLAIEVKAIGGKPPTVWQRAFMEQVRKHGGIAFVATSVAEVERELLEALGEAP